MLTAGFGVKISNERRILIPVGVASGFMNGLIGMEAPPSSFF